MAMGKLTLVHKARPRRTYGGVLTGKTATKKIKKVVTSMSETKQVRRSTFLLLGKYASGVLPINNLHVTGTGLNPQIIQGNGVNERVGNKVHLRWVDCSVFVNNSAAIPDDNAYTIRLIVGYATALPSSDSLAVPDIAGNDEVYLTSQLRRNGQNNFKILTDKCFKMKGSQLLDPMTFKRRYKLNRTLRWSEGIDSSIEGFELFLYAFAVNNGTVVSANNISLEVSSTWNYTDF